MPAAAVFAEFAGTCMLTFTAGCVSVGAVPAAWAPVAVGSALMVLVYGIASVSGGHINPAVSLAVGMSEKMNIPTVVIYIISQMLGGIVGAFSSRHINDATPLVGPRPNTKWWEAMVAEVVYTALLSFVFLSVTAKRNHPRNNSNHFYGLGIGSAVTAAGGAIGTISGALLNPAIAFGFGMAGTAGDLHWGALYVLYQAIGGAVGAYLFYITHPEDFMHDQHARAYEPAIGTMLLSEFVGTFYLVLTFTLCIWARDSVSVEGAATPWSVAAVLIALIYSLGDVSGGHFNPAVTLAAWLCRKIDIGLITSILYAAFQLGGGILAALLCAGLCNGRTFPIEPRVPYTEWAAYVFEGIFTAMLCLAMLSTGYAKGIQTALRRNYYFGLACGFVFSAGHVACAKVSVGVLNPAVAFGIASAHKLNYGTFYYALSYSLAESIGAAVAVIVFVVVHAEAYKPKPLTKPQLSAFDRNVFNPVQRGVFCPAPRGESPRL